ncbi:GNAT family N-acetyltransferase [Spirillospora sp. CA-128828]|uniref:GNAT family N-acetyltransferase n=1 Tax=Spirillospora sp. CA-128828 TaxID=3240033 RepID=UPI003D8A93D6
MLVGTRVTVRPVAAEDGAAFVVLARQSLRLHRHLIYAPTTATEFGRYLARFDGVAAVGFVVRLNGSGELAGLVNINDISWTPERRGFLGFGGFAATSGHGYVGEAVRLVVRYAFEDLGLDRLEADVQPVNAASRKVVERAGFRLVASPPKAIRIDGEWRDHERWVLTAEPGRRRGGGG